MPEILPIPKCGEHRQCLACAFPFWDKLTAEQQEILCRTTRPVRYRKGERSIARWRTAWASCCCAPASSGRIFSPTMAGT